MAFGDLAGVKPILDLCLDSADFESDLEGHRDLLTYPARDGARRVVLRLDVDLVVVDVQYLPRPASEGELDSGLCILRHERLLKHADGGLVLRLEYEVVLLVGYHAQVVEEVGVDGLPAAPWGG